VLLQLLILTLQGAEPSLDGVAHRTDPVQEFAAHPANECARTARKLWSCIVPTAAEAVVDNAVGQ
jgi:hypothetical protein